MRIIGFLFAYLFVCGLFVGPLIGDRMRCGEKTETLDWLAMPIALPMLLGVAITSGTVPPYSAECAK